jgi:hypothetical protein
MFSACADLYAIEPGRREMSAHFGRSAVVRFPGEWRKPCPERDALREGKRTYARATPCARCGGNEFYASGNGCVACSKERSRAAVAPLDAATVNMIDRITGEICSAMSVEEELRGPIRVLVASLFAGAGATRIARSLGMRHSEVNRYGERLRDGHIWNWSGPVPKEVQAEWFHEERGNMAIVLDALVATGELLRSRDGRYKLREPSRYQDH